MRKWFPVVVVLVSSCSKPETATTTTTIKSSTATTSSIAASSTTTQVSVPAGNLENLLSLASGAFPVIRASAPEQGGEAYYMFDDDPKTSWVSKDHQFKEPTVVEMADRAIIRRVEFDEANIDWDGRLPRKILVEVSDSSPTTGFKPIVEGTMTEMKDAIAFPVSAEVPGRWVRLTVEETPSTSGIAQITEMRAFGERITHNPMPNVTGTYDTDVARFHLKQDGATVTGCYEPGTEALNGGMEGRILKFKYAVGESGSGPAILIVSDDGHVFGGWWRTDGASEHPKLSPIEGKRVSTDPGNTACPQWKGTPERQLAATSRKRDAFVFTASISTAIRMPSVRSPNPLSTRSQRCSARTAPGT